MIKQILLFGAGKSTTVLINYLLEQSIPFQWKLTVVDSNLELAQSKVKGHINGNALSFDISDAEKRGNAIANADMVISMLPPALHYLVALDCIHYGKNLLTASYLDNNIRQLKNEIEQKGLIFLCEMGLDPGIDHMSAMQLIDTIKANGGIIHRFISHCGGLVSPESDSNPWHYKITWNPANIVNAGKQGALYKIDNQYIKIDYLNIFKNTSQVHIPSQGQYAYYPNRDSISYATLYGLEDANTFMRTTLRHPDFCIGWQYLIEAGLTNQDAITDLPQNASIAQWFQQCIHQSSGATSFEDYLRHVVKTSDQTLLQKQLEELQVNSKMAVPSGARSSADILQYLLETNLKMQPNDKDMIIMLHEIDYQLDDQFYKKKSCMVVKGENAAETAMAKTVGLPLAIATELILERQINIVGLKIPIEKQIYVPVLEKLKEKQIIFDEL